MDAVGILFCNLGLISVLYLIESYRIGRASEGHVAQCFSNVVCMIMAYKKFVITDW